MSRMLPGNTFRQATATVSLGPAATSIRQQTHVSPSSSFSARSTRDPRSVTRARYVPAVLGPSRLSIQDTITVPSGIAPSPSNECEIGRSSFTRRGAVERLALRRASARDEDPRRRARPRAVGLRDDHDT